MGCQRLSRLLLLPIVPLTLMVFCARLACTQQGPSASDTLIQLSGSTAQLLTLPEVKIPPVHGNLWLNLAAKQEQTPFQAGFRSSGSGYRLSATANSAFLELQQLAKRDAVQAHANHFI